MAYSTLLDSLFVSMASSVFATALDKSLYEVEIVHLCAELSAWG
jgi:hypothetical protein